MANAHTTYDYHSTEHGAPTSPYGSGDPYYSKSSGYITSGPARRSKKNWLKIGIPIAILVIIGAVVGGVLGSRASKKNSDGSSGDSNSSSGGGNGVNNGLGRFPVSTDAFYGMPIYPSTVGLLSYPSVECDDAYLSFSYRPLPPPPLFLIGRSIYRASFLSRRPDKLCPLRPADILCQRQGRLA